ncbi:MAG: Hsp20/alpha crystallin family protein [Promethearchaeota archaeon]
MKDKNNQRKNNQNNKKKDKDIPNQNNNNNEDFGFSPFRFPDIRKIFEKIFKTDLNMFKIPFMDEDDFSDLKKVKTNSFTFRFGTGMDKPEIRINGVPVDIDEYVLKNMFDNLNNGKMIDFNQIFGEGFDPSIFGNMFNNMPQIKPIPEIDASQIKLENEDEKIKPRSTKLIKEKIRRQKEKIPSVRQYETPYYELQENEDSIEITLELPYVKKEDIIINYFDNKVTITADSEFKSYQKSFDLKFIPDKKKTKIYGNNGVYQIIFKK